MGARFDGICFDSAAAAARAHFTSVAPAVAPGATTYVSTVEEGPTDQWSLVTREGSVVVSVESLAYPGFEQCDLSQSAMDGMTLGWMVVGVWVTGWAISMLRRTFG